MLECLSFPLVSIVIQEWLFGLADFLDVTLLFFFFQQLLLGKLGLFNLGPVGTLLLHFTDCR